MSFSMQVKDELVKTEYEAACCKKSLLYGMCIFGKSFSAGSVSLQTENEHVAELYANLLKELFNINYTVKNHRREEISLFPFPKKVMPQSFLNPSVMRVQAA